MRLTVKELREIIRRAICESPWDFKHDVAAAHAEEAAAKEQDKKDRRAKGAASFSELEEDSFSDEIAEKQGFPEFQTIEAFVQSAMDDIADPTDIATFEATDLHALTRNVFSVDAAGVSQLRQVRAELEGYGLRYVPRATVKAARGVTSNPHGKSPYAGMGGGGSGFSSGGLGMGGGPGSVGGKQAWDPKDPRSLGMGSKKR